MMWYVGGLAWGGWFTIAVFMVLFWTLINAAVIALVHHLTGAHHHQQSGLGPPSGEPRWGSQRAENLLAEPFARGEIDDEYKCRRTLLREH